MGTIFYYEEQVKSDWEDKTVRVEAGTSSSAGNGPQMFIKLGDDELLFSHKDAIEFFQAIVKIGNYFGYPDPDLTGQWVLRRD